MAVLLIYQHSEPQGTTLMRAIQLFFSSLAMVLCLVSASVVAGPQMQFQFAPDISLLLTAPARVVHANDLIILDYGEWKLTHEHIDPASYYQGIDLSGMISAHIAAVFEPSLRKDQPLWLAGLAEELAQGLGLERPAPGKALQSGYTLYQHFQAAQARGVAYLVAQDAAQVFTLLGPEQRFKQLVDNLQKELSSERQ